MKPHSSHNALHKPGIENVFFTLIFRDETFGVIKKVRNFSIQKRFCVNSWRKLGHSSAPSMYIKSIRRMMSSLLPLCFFRFSLYELKHRILCGNSNHKKSPNLTFVKTVFMLVKLCSVTIVKTRSQCFVWTLINLSFTVH